MNPSELAYCKASVPAVSSTLLVASLMAFRGKSSRLGRPPAKEMVPGSVAALRISRKNERGTSVMRSANRVFIEKSQKIKK